eukprot:COSAG06_NODE_201_length_20356_cov_7.834140_3_plen_1046_part_00
MRGSSGVCGSSHLVGEFGSSDLCVRERSYIEAESLCGELGSRLCTVTELQDDEGDPEACGYASIFKWSWADTPVGACPNANQSLGMPGRSGAWFSFVPTALHAYYEIQLRAVEHDLDGDSFEIVGVFDSHAEITAGQPSTLHYREGGAMLRTNATQIGGETFVHVRSTVADAAYTIAAVQAPEYSWRAVPVEPAGRTDATEILELQRGGAVAVDLPFDFPFFGLEHRRVWVSSFGMVLLEEPRAAGDHFGGTAHTHSAIMAAAGEFDMGRAGSFVTASQLSPTEVQIAWHAPLFSSDIFSDVSMVLTEQGNVTLEWRRVDLSGGGSLGHGLVSLLTFDDIEAELFAGDAISDSSGRSSDAAVVAPAGQLLTSMRVTDSLAGTTVGAFWGAEPGEGLDLSGDFVYAVSCNGEHTVGDLEFTPVASTPGILLEGDGATSQWLYPDSTSLHFYGASPVDIQLQEVVRNSWFAQGVDSDGFTLTLAGLIPQTLYVLQLMVYACCGGTNQPSNVFVDGDLVHEGFALDALRGIGRAAVPEVNQHAGAFIRVESIAKGPTMVVRLASPTREFVGINAFTLKVLDQPASASSVQSQRALRLIDDTYLQLPPMTLGGAIAVSAWVRVGTLWDGTVGITLFNSFESDGCGDTDVCRNAVDGTLDRGGWFAVGNDVDGEHPTDLWTANTVYDQGTAGFFWGGARDEWMMVTMSVSGREVSVYSADEQRGSALLSTRLPRMLRQNNYLGAAHRAPYQQKAGGIAMAIADLRLFDRSLSSSEVAALFADPASDCCISAGLKDAYGVRNLDLSLEAMRFDQPSAVIITPSEQHAGNHVGDGAQACVSDAVVATQQLDICGEINEVSECSGEIRDGTGPYGNSLDCGLQLTGFIGSIYTISFGEFETESQVDYLKIYDGPSADAPLLAELSGNTVPPPIVSSGRSVYLHFHSNDNTAAVGFWLSFSCAGTLVEYWKPSDVATPLEIGVVSPTIQQADSSTACLSNVLLSVQCCADATMSCAHARVTEIGLSDQSLRGSIPEAMGHLGALRTLKLHGKRH